MSIVIGEFEVIKEPDTAPAADTESREPVQSASGVTPEAFARVERHIAERALRTWAD